MNNVKTPFKISGRNIFLVTFLLLVVDSAKPQRIPSFAGPYDIIWGPIYNKPSADVVGTGEILIAGYIQSYHFGHPQFVHGRSFNKIPIDDGMKVAVSIDSMSNNQWKKNAFNIKLDKACSSGLKFIPSGVKLVFGEDGKRCPIPEGEREIKNQTLKLTFKDFPVFPYGHYRCHLKYIQNDTIVGGMTLETRAVPKRPSLRP